VPAGWGQLLNWGGPWQSSAAGTALTTAVTATISPQATGPKDFSIPTSYLYQNATLRVTANGILTTTATSTTATIFLGAGSAPTNILTAPGITTGTTVITGIPWWWTSWHTIINVATSGNVINSWGWLELGNSGAALIANPVALTATPGMTLPCPPSGGQTTGSGPDTTVALPIMLRGTLAGANATIQCQNFLVEHLYG